MKTVQICVYGICVLATAGISWCAPTSLADLAEEEARGVRGGDPTPNACYIDGFASCLPPSPDKCNQFPCTFDTGKGAYVCPADKFQVEKNTIDYDYAQLTPSEPGHKQYFAFATIFCWSSRPCVDPCILNENLVFVCIVDLSGATLSNARTATRVETESEKCNN